MMTSLARADEISRPHRDLVASAGGSTDRVTGLVSLLFALNLAVGLPPKAIVPPPTPTCPKILRRSGALVNSGALAVVLGRLTLHVGCGRIILGDVDERLRGLVVSLDVFRVIDRSGALIGVGVARPDPTAPGGATLADLWRLARAALAHHGVAWAHPGTSWPDAFLAEYGPTAQLAWLAGDRLVTVSVTQLNSEQDWTIRTARAIATLADDHRSLHGDLE